MLLQWYKKPGIDQNFEENLKDFLRVELCFV